MNMQNIYRIFPLIFLLLTSCRGDEPVPAPREITVSSGFYLLNEGNKGNNMATLDYFDYTNNTYYLNIYAERNPTVVKELGDVGNDLQIYGNRLYAVINCSNFIEVTDLKTTKHIGMIQIPSCRYIVFHKNKAYVSSYAQHRRKRFIRQTRICCPNRYRLFTSRKESCRRVATGGDGHHRR